MVGQGGSRSSPFAAGGGREKQCSQVCCVCTLSRCRGERHQEASKPPPLTPPVRPSCRPPLPGMVLTPQRVCPPPRLAVLDPPGGSPFAPASASLGAGACAAGRGQHGRRPGEPAAAAPLPAARRCRRRHARLQPAPQPGGDLPHQPCGRRGGCALGPGPAAAGGGGVGGSERAAGRLLPLWCL